MQKAKALAPAWDSHVPAGLKTPSASSHAPSPATATHQQSNAKDLRGGLVTLLSSVYIVLLIPAILRVDSLPSGLTTVAATAFACALGTALFALCTRQPFAIGPGIVPASMVAAFLASGIPFQVVLGIEFFAGLLFTVLVLTGGVGAWVRRMSPALKTAGQIAIGLYLFLAALKVAGITYTEPSTGHAMLDQKSWLFLMGLASVFVLMNIQRLQGYAILAGMVVATAGAAAVGMTQWPESTFAVPQIQLFAPDLAGAMELQYLDEMLILLYVVVVDVVATLETIAICSPQLRAPDGRLQNFDRSMLMSAVVFLISPLLGTTPLLIFFESLGGVMSGARTWRAAAVLVVGFVMVMFFAPLAGVIPAFACAVALGYIGYVITKYAAIHIQIDPASLHISRLSRYLIAIAIVATLVTQSVALAIFCLFAMYPICAHKAGHPLRTGDVVAAGVCMAFMGMMLG
jgi:adenine/guanine/hypoxanthine permease